MAATQQNIRVEPGVFGPLLLDMGTALLRSGGNSSRIRLVMVRIASAYQFKPYLDIDPKSIALTLLDADGQAVFNGTRSIPEQGVNFRIVSGINRLSWSVADKQWPLQQLEEELDRLLHLPHYPRLVILLLVGLAGAAFCSTFGGNAAEMSVAFGATFLGLFIKQQLVKKSINTYACTYLGALVATLFTGAFYKFGTGIQVEHAFATSVLFLIPGVPLINSFTDLMEGDILNGLERGVNALMHALAIAFGLSTTLFILNYQG